MARRIGDDELALRRGEITVGDIDGDALLAFGTQAVGKQRKVQVFFAALLGRAFDCVELVLEDRLGIVEQTADEGGFAVVAAARRGEAEQVHGKVVSVRHRG